MEEDRRPYKCDLYPQCVATFALAHEKARHMRRGQHKRRVEEAPSEGLRDNSSQGGAIERLRAAANRLRSRSSNHTRSDTQPGPSRLDVRPDAAELNQDETGYAFAPECDATAVDIDGRAYRFIRTAAGGSGLSRADIAELTSILVEIVANPDRLTLKSLAEFDKYEEAQLAGANIEPFEQVELTKEGDLKPVILWRRSALTCVTSLYENVANAQGFVVRPPKNCNPAKRIYKGPETGSWWREVLRLLPATDPGKAVAAVIIYSEETTLTVDGGLKGWPVYISLANIAPGNRWKPHGHRLCALLPDDDGSFFTHADSERWHLEVFQEALDLIMKDLKMAQNDGVELTDPYGIRRTVFPITYAYIGDYPEQCKVAGTKSGIKTRFPCPRCTVPKEQLNNMTYPLKYRTEALQKERVMEMERETRVTARNDLTKLYSTHFVKSALWGQRFGDTDFGNPYRQLTSDIMHMSLLGVYKHILEGLKSKLTERTLRELDAALERITNYSRQSFFRVPSHTAGYFSGHNTFKAFHHQAVMQVLPALLVMAKVDQMTIRAVELYCTWHREAWHRTLVPMLMDEFTVDDQASNFNVPKIHAMLHVSEDIRRRGVPIHYCTDVYEHVHVVVMKRPYRASNKRNAEEAITRRCLISELVEWMSARDEAIETGIPTVTGTSTKFVLGDERNKNYMAYVESVPGDFDLLEDSIVSYLKDEHGDDKVHYARMIEVHSGVAVPPDDDFMRYSRYPQYARATPAFHGGPWFSDVDIEGEDDEKKKVVWHAKLFLIFTLRWTVCTSGEGDEEDKEEQFSEQLAFCRYYGSLPQSATMDMKTLNWWPSRRGYGVLPVESILRVRHVVPKTIDPAHPRATFMLNHFRW
ncbi:unnamed protein product [Closterium sp. Yama58-4]|nr:unnamed protein product [Closterium sp. Yama58-4]